MKQMMKTPATTHRLFYTSEDEAVHSLTLNFGLFCEKQTHFFFVWPDCCLLTAHRASYSRLFSSVSSLLPIFHMSVSGSDNFQFSM